VFCEPRDEEGGSSVFWLPNCLSLSGFYLREILYGSWSYSDVIKNKVPARFKISKAVKIQV